MKKYVSLIYLLLMTNSSWASEEVTWADVQNPEWSKKYVEAICKRFESSTWRDLIHAKVEIDNAHDQIGYSGEAYERTNFAHHNIFYIPQGMYFDANVDASNEYVHSMLLGRVLSACGAELQAKNLIITPSWFDPEKVTQCMKDWDEQYHQIMSDGELTPDDRLDRLERRRNCQDVRQTQIDFPLYFFTEDNDEKLLEKVNTALNSGKYEKNLTDFLSQTLLAVKGKIETKAQENSRRESEARMAQYLKEQDEAVKKERIEAVKGGDITAAENCYEIAEALVTTQYNNVFGAIVSTDSQAVYLEPTNEVYSSIGTLRGYESDTAILYDTNQFTNNTHFSVLNLKDTIWFDKPKIAIGAKLYYVGRYSGNQNLEGTNGEVYNSRVYDVTCAMPVR